MEKYGVDLDPEQTKVSEEISVQRKCARCGSPLEASANVPKCPKCGTEPFEPNKP